MWSLYYQEAHVDQKKQAGSQGCGQESLPSKCHDHALSCCEHLPFMKGIGALWETMEPSVHQVTQLLTATL